MLESLEFVHSLQADCFNMDYIDVCMTSLVLNPVYCFPREEWRWRMTPQPYKMGEWYAGTDWKQSQPFRKISTVLKNVVPCCPLLGIKGTQKWCWHSWRHTADCWHGVSVFMFTFPLCSCLLSSFYSSPYSLAPNRMIAQTSLSPYMHSPVSSYQVGLYLWLTWVDFRAVLICHLPQCQYFIFQFYDVFPDL